MSEPYQSDFETFLKHTDEKPVLLEALERFIAVHNVKSILDIGAGKGDLAAPISRLVETYLAVEAKPAFVELLRAAGLKVTEGKFPVAVEGEFDMVLICHALSRLRELWEPFITEAWKRVREGGSLAIVTYRGEEDDWTQLMRLLGNDPLTVNRVSFIEMLKFLESIGSLVVERITTTVSSESFDDMLHALSFVASDGVPERKESYMRQSDQIQEILESKYRSGNRYSFPFRHYFVSVRKQKS